MSSAGYQSIKHAKRTRERKAFTLIELVVVLGIIALLMGILMPVLVKIRRQARTMLGTGNKRQVTNAASLYAMDNDGRYPESVATLGVSVLHWNWQEPTMVTGYEKRSPRLHRSMSGYLGSYICDASIMFCPNSPKKYRYFEQAWAAGDEWDNPDTSPCRDPVTGTYCFYWNYIGFLGGGRGIFKGPQNMCGGRGQSKVLVTDYFGYNHWRSPNAYGSCERFKGAGITPETWVSSAYWSRVKSNGKICPETLNIKLYAGYTDGHVESYTGSEVVRMKVSLASDGSVPYPDGVGPGDFYLPCNSLAPK